jgi:hypothetical protein
VEYPVRHRDAAEVAEVRQSRHEGGPTASPVSPDDAAVATDKDETAFAASRAPRRYKEPMDEESPRLSATTITEVTPR